MYLPEEDPSPLSIGNGIKRKPYVMFPYWQKRKISLLPLLCQLRPFPEPTQCSEPVGKRPCLLLIWLDSQVDPLSNKARARSSKQAGDQEQRVRRKLGKKQDLSFFMGVSTARSIRWNHNVRAEGIGLLSMWSVWKWLVGWRNTAFPLPPSLPPISRCLAMLICLIHRLQAQKKSLPSAKI